MESYLLFPFGDYDLKNAIFESPYGQLRKYLAQRNINLQTYDQGDLFSAAKVLCFNHRPIQHKKCLAAGLRPEQLVLFLMEPAPVIPSQYTPQIWGKYGTVFTFLDNLVDGKKFHKMFYPQGQTLPEEVRPWFDRKFLVMMNANKYSYVPHELYSKRRAAIRYFERSDDFDLYGFGWDTNGALSPGAFVQALRFGQPSRYLTDLFGGFRHSPSYRGSVKDKHIMLAQYKFCLAFENEACTQGYITEKIFDCFFAGSVPVYFGADNVTDYIPSNCFVDLRKFSSFDTLETYLRQMSEADWAAYHNRGQAFIRSTAFARWQPENVFASIAGHL